MFATGFFLDFYGGSVSGACHNENVFHYDERRKVTTVPRAPIHEQRQSGSLHCASTGYDFKTSR